jgi:hypothetical protein
MVQLSSTLEIQLILMIAVLIYQLGLSEWIGWKATSRLRDGSGQDRGLVLNHSLYVFTALPCSLENFCVMLFGDGVMP